MEKGQSISVIYQNHKMKLWFKNTIRNYFKKRLFKSSHLYMIKPRFTAKNFLKEKLKKLKYYQVVVNP